MTTNVHATVTTYDDSVASHPDADEFWDYYLGLMGHPGTVNTKSSDSNDFTRRLTVQALFNQQKLAILMDDLRPLNTSWMFAAFVLVINQSAPDFNSSMARNFRKNAMLFHTRCEACKLPVIHGFRSLLLLQEADSMPCARGLHQYNNRPES